MPRSISKPLPTSFAPSSINLTLDDRANSSILTSASYPSPHDPTLALSASLQNRGIATELKPNTSEIRESGMPFGPAINPLQLHHPLPVLSLNHFGMLDFMKNTHDGHPVLSNHDPPQMGIDVEDPTGLGITVQKLRDEANVNHELDQLDTLASSFLDFSPIWGVSNYDFLAELDEAEKAFIGSRS